MTSLLMTLSILATPCLNFKEPIDLDERSKLAEGETRLPSLCGRRRNTKTV